MAPFYYLIAFIFWCSISYLFRHIHFEDYSLSTGTFMWITWMAIWSWEKGEDVNDAIVSGTKRYFVYFGTAIVTSVFVGGSIALLGGSEAYGFAWVFGILSYIITIAYVYYYRHPKTLVGDLK